MANGTVVLHADDFGMNEAVNRGIVQAFREGLLTSTSLLANAPAAELACSEWRQLLTEYGNSTLPSLGIRRELGEPPLPFDLGIHLNLTQGRPLTGDRYPTALLNRDGIFPGIGTVFRRLMFASASMLKAVSFELETQIEWMCNRGLQPTHLNGHQYVELIPKIAAIIPSLLQRYSIPVIRVACEPALCQTVTFRGQASAWSLAFIKRFFATKFRYRMQATRAAFPDRFFGTAHAGRVDQETLSLFLSRAIQGGATEIGLHPGTNPEGASTSSNVASELLEPALLESAWFDPLAKLRNHELTWLCCPTLRDELLQKQLRLGRLQSLPNVKVLNRRER